MKKILILDDNLGNLDVLSILFVSEGYEVSTLSKPEEIYQRAAEFQPNIILVDILLGSGDGIEICNELKKEPRTANIKLILMSACNKNLKRAIENGCADDYLAKPYDIDTVTAMVTDLLS